MTRDVYIKAIDLSFSIDARPILGGLNFEVAGGRVYGLFGANGSGKTTLFNLLSGVYRPSSGRVLLYGAEPRRYDPYHVSTHGAGLSRTFQVPAVADDLSVMDNLLLSFRLPGEGFSSLFHRTRISRRAEDEARRKITRVLERFDLGAKAGSPAGALSFGERRLLTNVGALLTGAKIMLLDEPFANLNARHVATLKELLRGAAVNEGRAVLLIDHTPDNMLGLADALLQLRGRKVESYEVAAGSQEELVRIVHSTLFSYE